MLATCSTNEAAIWSMKQDQPVMILDEPSPDSTLQSIFSTKIAKKGGNFVACIGSEDVTLYQVNAGASTPQKKHQGNQQTVKTCDCRVSLGGHTSANA